jgi:hypothetical protein
MQFTQNKDDEDFIEEIKLPIPTTDDLLFDRPI